MGPSDRVSTNYARVSQSWEIEKLRSDPSLLRAFALVFWKDLLPSVFHTLMYIAFNIFSMAFLQRKLLELYENPQGNSQL